MLSRTMTLCPLRRRPMDAASPATPPPIIIIVNEESDGIWNYERARYEVGMKGLQWGV